VLSVTGTRKFDRGLGRILHDQLHWLDVSDRVLFELAVTVHQSLNGCAPSICRSTASRSPVLTRGGISVPPTVTYLPYRVSGYLRPSGVLSCWPDGLELTPGIQRAAQTVLGVYLKLTCSHVTSASSALGVLTILRYTNPRTH